MKILYFFLLSIAYSIAFDCECAKPNPPLNLTKDINLQPHKNYQIEWWYYLLNLSDNDNVPYQFIVYFTRNTNYNNCGTQYEHHTELIKINDYTIEYYNYGKTNFTDKLDFKVNSTIKRIDDATIIVGDNFYFVIKDGTGLKLQGSHHDGFVPSRTGKCNGAYSASFLGLDIYGYINNVKLRGIGYGEHVFLSSQTVFENSILNGWHCHYFHFEIGNMQICDTFDSKYKNARHGMIEIYGMYRWLERNDIKTTPIDYWKSPKTFINYPISWNINIDKYDLVVNLIAMNFNNEINNKKWWIGNVYGEGIYNGIKLYGIGFNEIMLF